jgi:hypothetical protein
LVRSTLAALPVEGAELRVGELAGNLRQHRGLAGASNAMTDQHLLVGLAVDMIPDSGRHQVLFVSQSLHLLKYSTT